MRETAVKRLTLFKHFTILYVVYFDFFDFSEVFSICTMKNPTSLTDIVKCCAEEKNVSTCMHLGQ